MMEVCKIHKLSQIDLNKTMASKIHIYRLNYASQRSQLTQSRYKMIRIWLHRSVECVEK